MDIPTPKLYLRHEAFTHDPEPVTPALTPPSHPTHITFATTELPLRALHLSRGLRKHEIAITHKSCTYFLTPASALPAFRAFITALHQLTLSPPRYTLTAPLARGAFGTVHHAVSPSHPRLAIKRVPLTNPFWRSERDILAGLPAHPNVIPVREAFLHRQHLHLVMPLLRDLSTLPQPLPLTQAVSLIRSLLSAVAHLHKHSVCHNDIKPENLLLRDGYTDQVVLTDFGLATNGRRARGGTQAFRPPTGGSAQAGDVWSVGVVAFVLVTGRMPWDDARERVKILRRMREEGSAVVVGEAVQRLCGEGYDAVAGLLKGLLQVHAGKRLTARAALEHDVFGGGKRSAWSVKRVFRGVLVGVRWLDSWQRGRRVGRTLLL